MRSRSAKFKIFIGSVSFGLILLAGCFGNDQSTPAPDTAPPAEAPSGASQGNSPTSLMVDSSTQADVELKIGSDGDNIAYDKTTLEVKAGSTVKLTFKSNVKTSGMEHNWILAKPGTETEIANASIQAGQDKGWLADQHPGILAHTRLIKAGESDTIVFKAPAAGEYPFFCSFPGHAIAMKGVLKVN